MLEFFKCMTLDLVIQCQMLWWYWTWSFNVKCYGDIGLGHSMSNAMVILDLVIQCQMLWWYWTWSCQMPWWYWTWSFMSNAMVLQIKCTYSMLMLHVYNGGMYMYKLTWQRIVNTSAWSPVNHDTGCTSQKNDFLEFIGLKDLKCGYLLGHCLSQTGNSLFSS